MQLVVTRSILSLSFASKADRGDRGGIVDSAPFLCHTPSGPTILNGKPEAQALGPKARDSSDTQRHLEMRESERGGFV